MKSFQIIAEIISNKNIKKNYFEIVLLTARIARNALPGQFVNIKVSDGVEPLLRRPLSIHKVIKNNIVMLYEAVGKGTEILSRRKTGECLDVIGPLGNSFSFNRELSIVNCQPILVAGGMGTAPLIFLAEKLKEIKNQKSPGKAGSRQTLNNGREKLKTLVLIGAKTKDSILCEKEFKELGCEVKIATDDGSRSFKGYVSELLKQELSTIDHRLSTIYACGPTPLLKEVSRISLERNIPAQLSLESHMACGIGACMGCVIKVTKSQGHKVTRDFEYQRVCKEGPVFKAEEIIW